MPIDFAFLNHINLVCYKGNRRYYFFDWNHNSLCTSVVADHLTEQPYNHECGNSGAVCGLVRVIFSPDEDAESTEHKIKGKSKDETHSVIWPDVVLSFLWRIAKIHGKTENSNNKLNNTWRKDIGVEVEVEEISCFILEQYAKRIDERLQTSTWLLS